MPTRVVLGNDLTISFSALGQPLVNSQLVIKNYYDDQKKIEWIQLGDADPVPMNQLVSQSVTPVLTQAQVSGSGQSTLNLSLIADAGVKADLTAGTITYVDPGTQFEALTASSAALSIGDDIIGFVQTISGFQHIVGSEFNDWLVGNPTGNEIESGAGNDLVQSGSGDDVIVGGSGEGDDTYDGGDGIDSVVYSSATQGITVNLSLLQDQASGSEIGTDQIIGIENVVGGNGDDHIVGTLGANTLVGDGGNDTLSGLDGNDTLDGGAGNDTIDGGAGVDTAVYSSNRAAYAINGTAPNLTVSGPDGFDTLSNVERLQFSDKGLAFDLGLGEAAGNTVRIIGAAFDGLTIQLHPDYVGIGLDLFDGGWTMPQVCELVIPVMGSPSNVDFVNTVYQNLVGAPPSQAELDLYVGLLQGSGGTMTQAELLMFAANTEANALNIELVGLQASGVEFV